MRLLIISLYIISTLGAHAAINPIYSEASERGYEIDGDSVVFPDNTKCALSDFNDGTCGQEWMTDDYCIPEGAYVWNEDKCCEGLKPYLPEGMDGQAKCVKVKDGKNDESSDNWFTSLIDNSMFWIGILLPFILLMYIAFSVKKKMKKEDNQNE